MSSAFSFHAEVDESSLQKVAMEFANHLRGGECVYLIGDLGAGKTTFARALIQFLTPGVRVKSPTYTLIERYQAAQFDVVHADLYRLVDAMELIPLGLLEALDEGAVALIEWPERGAGVLPPANWRVKLAVAGDKRMLKISAASPSGAGV